MKYLIIFYEQNDGSCGEWTEVQGTEEEARHYATSDRRHMNYGRRGYRLVQLGKVIAEKDGRGG